AREAAGKAAEAPRGPSPPRPSSPRGRGGRLKKQEQCLRFLSLSFSLLSLGERRAGVVRGPAKGTTPQPATSCLSTPSRHHRHHVEERRGELRIPFNGRPFASGFSLHALGEKEPRRL